MNRSGRGVGGRVGRFTLIELLVVIAIIAILAGLLLPAVVIVRRTAVKTKAKSMAKSLEIAIAQYESQYGLLPASSSDFQGPPSNEKLKDSAYENMIAILCKQDYPGTSGSADKGNPRGTHFLEVPAKYTTEGYVDPWGQKFFVAMDSDYDGDVEGLYSGTLSGKVFVYSAGSDTEDDNGNATEDVVSWQ